MRERPILFSAPMVRALLAGTKTQTRRVVKGIDPANLDSTMTKAQWRQVNRDRPVSFGPTYFCPYGQPGDRLWVRETWAFGIHALAAKRDEDGPFVYAADGTTHGRLCERWRPSIHMPRHACRLILEITGVRVERLHEISEADARAEGCPFTWDGKQYEPPLPQVDSWQGYGRASFSLLWSQINGADSWTANPWVWVVEFRVLQPRTDGGGRG